MHFCSMYLCLVVHFAFPSEVDANTFPNWYICDIKKKYYLLFFNFLLILCRFHIMLLDSTYLPVPSYLPSALVTPSKQNQI